MSGRNRTPPGPKGHLFVGSFPEFRRKKIHFYEECARRYGDVVGFKFWHIPCCLLSHPQEIENVLVRQNADFIKSRDIRELKIVLGDGLLSSEGSLWREQRQLIQPIFHRNRIEDYSAAMVFQTKRQISSWQDGDRRDLNSEMTELTLKIIADTMFGIDISSEVQVVIKAVKVIKEQYFTMLNSPIPLPLVLPTPGHLRLRRIVRQLKAIVFGMIRARREQGGKGNDLLSLLLHAQTEAKTRLSDRQICDEVTTILLAGHHTSALALFWSLYLLMHHPAVEAKLLEELTTVLQGRAPTVHDIPALPYLNNVLKESLRLYPPIASFGREAVRDLEVGGYRLVKGTQVMMMPYLVHRDPRFFDQPERFWPERWENHLEDKLPHFAYFPFGGGPRGCVGQGFAMVEVTLILAMLLQQFHFEPIPGQVVEIHHAINLSPSHGILATIKTRR